jgi:hypothetical protein
MIRTTLAIARAIEKGIKPSFIVVINFQLPETYDMEGKDDAMPLLVSVGDISQSMSAEGAYEIQNTTIICKNEKFYFSKKFSRELPDNKPVTVYLRIGSELIEYFRGVVSSGWTLTPTELSMSVHA